MECQGNGFKKITESYYAAHNYRDELEPKFYSDISTFQVTLYNLNYGQTKEKAVVSNENQLFETLLLGLKTKKIPEETSFRL